MVERRPQARGVERVGVAYGEGGSDADPLRDGGEKGKERDRVVLRRLSRAAERGAEAAGIGVGDVVEIGEEHHVEAAALANPRDMLIELGPVPGVARLGRLRVPPHGEAVIGGPVHQKLGEVHFLLFRHRGGVCGLRADPASVPPIPPPCA